MTMLVNNRGVTLPVDRTGSGRPVVFFNGGGATTVIWRRTIAALGDGYEAITFDFRGHGRASRASSYRLPDFIADADAVMASLKIGGPIVVGWSLGADVAVEYALAHRGAIAGLVLIDGALPTAGPLIADRDAMRRGLKSPLMRVARALMRLTPYRYAVPIDQYADLVIEVDEHRMSLGDAYDRLGCPTRMVLATATGHGNGANAERVNAVWRQSGERLAAEHPEIPVTWIEGSHRLPLTHPAEISAEIATIASR